MTTPAIAMSGKPEIPDTGLRGFLKWLQREQPGIYQQIAPTLPQLAPQGFSDYSSSQITRMRRTTGMLAQRRFGTLGDDTTTDGITSVTFDPDTFLQVPPPIQLDTSDAANSGSSSSSIMDTVSTAVNGLLQVGLAANSLNTAKQVTALQLQRAQAGLPPLNIDMSKMGVPAVSVGLSASTQSMLMWGGGALLLVLLLGGMAKSRS